MGLDMYVRKVNEWQKESLSDFAKTVLKSMSSAEEAAKFDIGKFVEENPTIHLPYECGEELCYWRKHPDLHGWMRDLFYKKGGESENGFNGDCVFLTKEDVLNLKSDIENQKLPETAGFFFGASYKAEEDRAYRDADDMKCIRDMLNALEDGDLIYYSSSW